MECANCKKKIKVNRFSSSDPHSFAIVNIRGFRYDKCRVTDVNLYLCVDCYEKFMGAMLEKGEEIDIC